MSKTCPVFLTLQLVAHKWSVRILRQLLHAEKNTLRFGQLQKGLDGITQRELTKHLREFEKAGIVERTVYAEVPPRVEYRLTRDWPFAAEAGRGNFGMGGEECRLRAKETAGIRIPQATRLRRRVTLLSARRSHPS